MNEFRTLGDAERVASQRQRDSATGVGAAVWAEVTEPGRDGLQLRLIVTDGFSDYDNVDVLIASATQADSAEVEARVEAAAGQFEAGRFRLKNLVANSPLQWSAFPSE